MLGYCTNYWATMPDITVYMNCDTRLAINLRMLNLGENDEFIFAIKNYNHIDSPYVYLFRARNTDMDENGEVIFKITPDISKQIKPGAFYNFTALIDAFNLRKDAEYRKLTENGNINIEYGAQELRIKETPVESDLEIIRVRLELLPDGSPSTPSQLPGKEIVGVRLEEVL